MKKALMVASVASMIEQFNMHNIQLLLDMGFQVDVACNLKEGSTISDERIKQLVEECKKKGVRMFHVPIPRSPLDIKAIINSINSLVVLFADNEYKLLHCHSPIGSVVARIAARKFRRALGTKVVYTAHGFHFYKGAPLKNWFLYYPIEKLCSLFTDVVITINQEDYQFARKKFCYDKIEYVPGIGIDTAAFRLHEFDRKAKRNELDISDDNLVILSVGELNTNKNHDVVIKAISKCPNKEAFTYVIAGKGSRENDLRALAQESGVNLRMLGYRRDIVELLNMADVFALPSHREGLSVALMEAMAAGLPCLASNIRGNTDLIEENKGGYLVQSTDVNGYAMALKKLSFSQETRKEMGIFNQQKIVMFDRKAVLEKMAFIYKIQ